MTNTSKWLMTPLVGGLLVLGIIQGAIAASSISLDWSATVSTPTSSLYGSMIALDAADNIFVTGSVPSTTIVTAKYDQSGTQLWQREFNNPNTRQVATWLATDPFGDVIVTGYLLSSDKFTPTGFVTIKYDANGNLMWQDVIGSGFTYAWRVATDAAGNAYVLGYGNTDIITIKYAQNGTRLWIRSASFDAFSIDYPAAMAIAPNGNVVVTGTLTVAYDANGNVLWSKSFATGPLDLAFGPNSEVYVVGGTYTQATGNVYLVNKLDANGNQIWSKTYPGYSAQHAAVDHAGDLIVTGVTTNGYMGWLTHKISAAGSLLWSQAFHPFTNVDEVPYFLTIGPNNEAYVTGQGGQVAPDQGGMGYLTPVTIRYATNGTQDWVAIPHTATRALGVRLASNNSVAVVGQAPMTVFKYVQTGAVNQPPVALASATPTSGVAPLGVSFSSVGSFDPDGSIAGYRWNFGDSLNETQGPSATHSYSASGVYQARLAVTDNMGATATSSVTITVQLALSSMFVSPYSVTVGANAQGTAFLTGPVPAGGAVVPLSSSNPAAAAVPASVTVPAGASSATFPITTSTVTTSTAVVITGNYTRLASATLTVLPSPTVTGLTLTPNSLKGSSFAYGTVTLSAPAPASGTVVSLSSSQTRTAWVPATVSVTTGMTTATFPISTSRVRRVTTVNITAAIGSSQKTAILSVTP